MALSLVPKDENLMKKLDELSPLNNVKRWNKIPLFLTRGKLDARVPEGDVLGLKNQLQENLPLPAKPYLYLVYG